MKINIQHRNLLLRLALFLLIWMLVLLGMYSFQKQEKYRNLQQDILLLETRLEHEYKKDLLRLDSLEQAVLLQEQINLQLKDSLIFLTTKRILLNIQSHENKAHIIGISDPDSLWYEVARHYRR